MKIGIIAPPFIPVPPLAYGGTELFIAQLARGLSLRGHEVVVYANGQSRVDCELKWRYRHMEWPVADGVAAQLKNADHTAWAVHDAAGSVDVLHLNDIVGVPLTHFIEAPVVLTLHHPHEPALTAQYLRYPVVQYVAISAAQARREPMPRLTVVHHGLNLSDYRFRATKDDYLVFLGRIAPCKGVHLAIEVARRARCRLKLAGERQPIFEDYWAREISPHIDGDRVEYLGEADPDLKNELLAGARALLFPIEWDEPFGLVMIEAMACGTPVLALRRGSVPEVVRDGVSGWVCRDVTELADRAVSLSIAPESCRAWVGEHFSLDRMIDRYVTVYEGVLSNPLAAQR